MLTALAESKGTRFEDCVAQFEAAWASGVQPTIENYLPGQDHPQYLHFLSELLRIELEWRWTKHEPTRLAEYAPRFPALFADVDELERVAFEEYRLRHQAGESPTREEYSRQFGVRTDAWGQFAEDVRPTVARDRAHPIQWLPPRGSLINVEVQPPDFSHAPTFRNHHFDASGSQTVLPRVGECFLQFQLVAELGQGAFGRVFLAEQLGLAQRSVALKVSTDLQIEAHSLAKLQHTAIMPIYSVHSAGKLQAVCMPYFGCTTLADIFGVIQQEKSLPLSGKGLVSTLRERRSRITLGGAESSQPSQSATDPKDPKKQPVFAKDCQGILEKLGSLSYIDAILWIGARLADGLAHAHDRGIIHRDLKPANVLLTDEGQPMLLDFNLAQDTQETSPAEVARIGGTLPYMAPEHLEAFHDGTGHVGSASDIYALGVIMYELLAGRPPFPLRHGPAHKLIPIMIADRRAAPPPLRHWNAQVTPAAEAIVRRCLEGDPANRYQNAHQLRDDIERHLKHLPLLHTREPSRRERMQKWVRRHPLLASTGSVTSCAVLLIAILLGGLALRGQHLRQLQAAESLREFEFESRTAQFLLYDRNADEQQLQDGYSQGLAALSRYQVLKDENWRAGPLTRPLEPPDLERLLHTMSEVLFVMTRAKQAQATAQGSDSSRRQEATLALHLNELAQKCYDGKATPRALLEQRADLLRLLGQNEQAAALDQAANLIPLATDRDYFLLGHKHALEGNFKRALPLLREATRRDPQNFAAWFVRGNCHYEMLQDAQAIGCFNSCIALRPEFHWSWFNRGLALQRLRQFQEAHDDFSRTIALKPDFARAYVNRGLAAEGTNRNDAAHHDFSHALALGARHNYVYFMRARVAEKRGDAASAAADRQAALDCVPVDEQSWVERGLTKILSDPQGALSDFENALAVNPRYFDALQNKAAILNDRLQKEAESLRVMEQVVTLYPESVLALGGRGVLLARQGKRDRAIRDAEEALLLDSQPPTLYQIACIYALTSKREPVDRVKALQLLAGALRAGFGLDWVKDDKDLDPLRALPEFDRMVRAARQLTSPTSP